MVSQHIINIMIKADNQASKVAEKVNSDVQRMGNNMKSSLNTANASTQNFKNSLNTVGEKTTSIGSKFRQTFTEFRNEINQSKAQGNNFSTTLSTAVGLLNSKIGQLGTSIQNKIGTSFDTIKNKWSTAQTKISSGLDSLKTKADALSNEMGEFGGLLSTVFGGIGLAQVYKSTVGLAMAREQMSTLMTATMGSKQEATAFLNTLDQLTNKSVVSLDSLGGSIAKIKISTGMTNQQLQMVAPTVNDVGQRMIMMGKSGEEAEQVMVGAFRGLNGEFEILKSNFGITKSQLVSLGWSGAASDVEGYNQALEKALLVGGSMNDLMKTATGRQALMEKNMRVIGRSIGEALLPAIQWFTELIIKLQGSCPWLFQAAIITTALGAAFAMIAPILGSAIGSMKSFLQFLGILKAEEGATTIKTIALTIAKKLGIITDTQAVGAAAAHATALGGQSIATGTATGAQIGLNTAMLANPALWVVVAIIALIAILIYLYKTNEQVKEAFDKLGAILKGGLIAAFNWLKQVAAAVWGVLQQVGSFLIGVLYPAFMLVTTPIRNVIGVIMQLGNAWNSFMNSAEGKALGDAFGQVFKSLQDAWASLQPAFMAIKLAFDTLMKVIFPPAKESGAATGVKKVGEAAQQANPLLEAAKGVISVVAWVLQYVLLPAFQGVAWVIQNVVVPIISAIIGYFTWFISFVTAVIDAVKWLWDILSGGAKSAGEGINSAFSGIMAVLQPIVDFLVATFKPVWDTIVQVFMIVWNYVQQLINIFWQFLTGQISLGEAIGMIWELMKSTFMSILSTIITGVITFISGLWNNFVNGVMWVVNGVVGWFASLPGKIWTWLMSVINYVVQFVSNLWTRFTTGVSKAINAVVGFFTTLPKKVWQWLKNTITKVVNFARDLWNKAKDAGKKFVDGLKDKVSNAPKMMWDELMKIGDKIKDVAGKLVQRAKDMGKDIVNAIKKALGIGSPGHIYYMFRDELNRVEHVMNTKANETAYLATKYGANIVKGVSEGLNEGFSATEAIATDLQTSQKFDIVKGSYVREEVAYTEEKKISLDINLENVPEGTNPDEVKAIIRESIPSLSKEIANSADFQSQNQRIISKNIRKNTRNIGGI